MTKINPTTIKKSVRFNGLPKDVDMKSDLGHQRRKERKLRRKERKEAYECFCWNIFLNNIVKFLICLAGFIRPEEHDDEYKKEPAT